jgi:hypothetical protein
MDQSPSYRRSGARDSAGGPRKLDRAEDELVGQERSGDELPAPLRPPEGCKQALAGAKRRLKERRGKPVKDEPVLEMDVDPESSGACPTGTPRLAVGSGPIPHCVSLRPIAPRKQRGCG